MPVLFSKHSLQHWELETYLKLPTHNLMAPVSGHKHVMFLPFISCQTKTGNVLKLTRSRCETMCILVPDHLSYSIPTSSHAALLLISHIKSDEKQNCLFFFLWVLKHTWDLRRGRLRINFMPPEQIHVGDSKGLGLLPKFWLFWSRADKWSNSLSPPYGQRPYGCSLLKLLKALQAVWS